jgi:uncharacterized protein (DUF3084 family)
MAENERLRAERDALRETLEEVQGGHEMAADSVVKLRRGLVEANQLHKALKDDIGRLNQYVLAAESRRDKAEAERDALKAEVEQLERGRGGSVVKLREERDALKAALREKK